MGTLEKEQIRESVRDTYGKVAIAGVSASGARQRKSCCGPPDKSLETIPVSSCGCGEPGFSVKQMSTTMGYSKEDMANVPEGANMGLGCGNPVALASLKTGETVVDLGSGGGFDCFLAAREVGNTGRVIGVDMTPEMVSKARKNAEGAETSNIEFRLGEIEHLPVADNSSDIVMSNCVINLSPDKQGVYCDAFRVLKPGGRLSISDVLATAPLPEKIRNDLNLLSACVGGAATIGDTEEMLEKAGFTDISITPKDNSRDLIRQWDPAKSQQALDYVFSAYIEAVKPSQP
ncbi:MAG: arsenite methyltransferase [Desulfobacteraceae bacterium]|nr:arsenite methyltransferase [Desulfobacteraceae bacterium]